MTTADIVMAVVAGLLCGGSCWVGALVGARDARRLRPVTDQTAQAIADAAGRDGVTTISGTDLTILVASSPTHRVVLESLFPPGPCSIKMAITVSHPEGDR